MGRSLSVRIDTEIKGIFFTDFVKRGNDYVAQRQHEVPSVYSGAPAPVRC